MITDGIHTHSSAIRIAQRTHPKGLVIVTDATPAMGLECGRHHIGTLDVKFLPLNAFCFPLLTKEINFKVEVTKDGRAVIAGTETLAGRYNIRLIWETFTWITVSFFFISIATMDECVRHLRKATNCSIVEAIESASLHPAQLLGIENKGRLNAGCDADFVFLDDELNPISTWIAGEKVYDRADS